MISDSLGSFFQDPLWGVLLRFVINLAALYIIIFIIHARFARSKENIFPFFLMGTMVFLICILLKNVEMHMGMALGLFAIFSIMRFRTENLITKNMAYLFAVTGVSVINAMFDFPNPVRGTILINIVVILTILALEIALSKYDKAVAGKAEIKAMKKAEKEAALKIEKKSKKKNGKKYTKHQVLYDNLGLLNQEKRAELLKDLSLRTGMKIDKVKIRKVDLIHNNAELDVSYLEKKDKKEEHHEIPAM